MIDEPVFGIREAARLLGIGRLTLSEQVRAGKIPNRGTPAAPKVSIEEARAARAQNLDAGKRQAPVVSLPGFAHHRSSLEQAKAEMAHLELARMKGQLLIASEVEEEIAESSREFRDALLRRWRILAVEMVGLSAREIEAKGMASDEAVLAELVTKLENQPPTLRRRRP